MNTKRAQVVRWRIARRHLNPQRSHHLRWFLLGLLVALLAATGVSVTGAYYFASQLPSVTKFQIHYPFQDARIYDSRGDLLYNMADLSKNRGQRIVEPLQGRYDYANPCRGGVNRIPLVLQEATISTEDASFYKNPGFDAMSIVRAAYDDIKYGRIVSGASTITQQVVRANLLNPHDRTLNRKAQEVALAYEISKRFSKRKILSYYLNSVPYGNLTYGAQAAAHQYFQEPVCRLDLAQAAFLAGLPRGPSVYNPVTHKAAAVRRMHVVLLSLLRDRYITSKAVIRASVREARAWHFFPPRAQMRYPQFTRYAIDQLRQIPAVQKQFYQGIDVYTTLDPRLQNAAQRTVRNQIDSLRLQNVTDGALVSLDLRTRHYGWILSMVGSARYKGRAGQINMAVTPRQPGSSMKPFNYIWAFTHGGVGPGTTVQDTPIALPDPNDVVHGGWYQPKDYDHQFHGTVTLREALANSLNVPAVKLEYYVTHPWRVAQTAALFGMSSLYRDNQGLDCSVCYALTLGGLTHGTRLLEETSAYGVFASGGRKVPPVAIWKVVRRNSGQILYCSEDCPPSVKADPSIARQASRVLDEAHAYEMSNVLSDNNARCVPHVCEFGLNSPLRLSRPAAAKTGTTNELTDNWTVGYTPQLVTGVWAGNADRSSMINVIGVTGAAPVWHDYMESAFKILKLPAIWYVPPANVVNSNQCRRRGSQYPRFGLSEIYVAPDPLPLCALRDKGPLPVSCAHYPSTKYLAYLRCPVLGRYTYTYGPNVPFNPSYSRASAGYPQPQFPGSGPPAVRTP